MRKIVVSDNLLSSVSCSVLLSTDCRPGAQYNRHRNLLDDDDDRTDNAPIRPWLWGRDPLRRLHEGRWFRFQSGEDRWNRRRGASDTSDYIRPAKSTGLHQRPTTKPHQ